MGDDWGHQRKESIPEKSQRKTRWDGWQIRDREKVSTRDDERFQLVAVPLEHEKAYSPDTEIKTSNTRGHTPFFFFKQMLSYWRLMITPPNRDYYHFCYRRGTGDSERSDLAPVVTQLGNVMSWHVIQVTWPESPSCRPLPTSGWKWHFRTLKIRTKIWFTHN